MPLPSKYLFQVQLNFKKIHSRKQDKSNAGI